MDQLKKLDSLTVIEEKVDSLKTAVDGIDAKVAEAIRPVTERQDKKPLKKPKRPKKRWRHTK